MVLLTNTLYEIRTLTSRTVDLIQKVRVCGSVERFGVRAVGAPSTKRHTNRQPAMNGLAVMGYYMVPGCSAPKSCRETLTLERFEYVPMLQAQVEKVVSKHRPLSSSFLGLPYRTLNMNLKRNYLGAYG